MVTLESTMTQKGQVTIPAEIRAKLGLKPRDRVEFQVDGDVVTLKPATSKIRRHFGTVTPRQRPEDWNVVRDEVEQMMAEDVAKEGNGV